MSAEQRQLAAVNDGDGADEARLGRVGATSETNLEGGASSSPSSSLALCAPSCSVPPASASPQPRPPVNNTGATITTVLPAAGESTEKMDGVGVHVPSTTLPASLQPPVAAIPVTEAIAVPSAALAGPTASQPREPRRQQQQQQWNGQDVLSLPAAACTKETVVAVARELQEYAEAVARARSSREAKGGGKGGGGGRDVAGGALGAGALGAVSPSLYLQEPPPEGLFDALLDQVVQALGDTW